MEICNSFKSHSFLSPSTQQQINISIRPRTRAYNTFSTLNLIYVIMWYACVREPTRVNIPRLYTFLMFLYVVFIVRYFLSLPLFLPLQFSQIKQVFVHNTRVISQTVHSIAYVHTHKHTPFTTYI